MRHGNPHEHWAKADLYLLHWQITSHYAMSGGMSKYIKITENTLVIVLLRLLDSPKQAQALYKSNIRRYEAVGIRPSSTSQECHGGIETIGIIVSEAGTLASPLRYGATRLQDRLHNAGARTSVGWLRSLIVFQGSHLICWGRKLCKLRRPNGVARSLRQRSYSI